MFPKQTRIRSKKILDTVKQMSCAACNRPPPSDPHHISSRGSGGHDTPANLVPLCRIHHTEIHQIGPAKMVYKYPNLKRYLGEK